MRYLSVCSGIEAATVAWHPLGWQPVGFSEIEPFPSAVLAHHYPDVPNYGDLTRYQEWNLDGAAELVVGGTPCQSFSVAGLRQGMADPRGNLALTFLGLVDRVRPRWVVWENVPGVLSSNGGRDFGAFLGALAQLGYGFAYRVLDAQYFGVAQRRRRVFVVGYLGDWRPAAAVLFERDSLRRDTAPRREARESVAPTVSAGPPFSRTRNERVEADAMIPVVGDAMLAKCLTARGAGGGNCDPETANMIPVSIQGNLIGRDAGGPQGVGASDDGVMYTLTKADVHGVAQPMAFTQNTRDEVRYINGDGQITGALAAEAGMKQTNYIAQPIAWDEQLNARENLAGATIAPSLTASNNPSRSPQSSEVTQQVASVYTASMQVRRLTPVECERLQGFPDGYTNIPWRNKPESPDGPRYKALGNSMAVPVMRWIGQRIAQVEDIL
jgi:DNA (cytosine-5)-methyltransferase 1